MQTVNKQENRYVIPDATTIGKTTLGVADLDKMVRYYEQVIGLTLLTKDASSAEMGMEETVALRLESRPNGKQHKNATGLFHLAILMPDQADLGQWLHHYIQTERRMIDGAGDHLVSEALYLSDPEGNGLEIYRDRPRETWQYEGNHIKMATLAVDLPALIAAAHPTPFRGIAQGTTIGHIHLQVHEVDEATNFYTQALGFGYMAGYPEASFVSAGGYHHHIGVNTWHSRGAFPPPRGSLGLICYEIQLPSVEDKTDLLAHLQNLGYPSQTDSDRITLVDPSGIEIVITATN